eukprot:TRINITY_DN3004_c0_g2_i3.p1 TRINITY_DN3004_c0_g2~~TRINITY_DN3004_c0_g2_i3.p1  ORF type:complete len:167 (+),score=61.50 TRINITY_DN3004_c0_g2_i3:186-686(+)
MSHLDETVILTSNDDQNFSIRFGNAILCETIKALASYPEDPAEQEEYQVPNAAIPLPPVPGRILEMVIEYCNYQHEFPEATKAEKTEFNRRFVEVDDETIFDLIHAANYLDIKSLLDVACGQVAMYIKSCKSPQEIRRRFNLKNDFTPEEEEETLKANGFWVEPEE